MCLQGFCTILKEGAGVRCARHIGNIAMMKNVIFVTKGRLVHIMVLQKMASEKSIVFEIRKTRNCQWEHVKNVYLIATFVVMCLQGFCMILKEGAGA